MCTVETTYFIQHTQLGNFAMNTKKPKKNLIQMEWPQMFFHWRPS